MKKSSYCFLFAYLILKTCFAMDAGRQGLYYQADELGAMLAESETTTSNKVYSVDSSWNIDRPRKFVQLALNSAISDVINANWNKHGAILEIGHGSGYKLSTEIDANVVKIQPDILEFNKLKESATKNIYHMDVADFCASIDSVKTISLVFAVHVFDTMNREIRINSLSQISKLQQPGDRLIFIMDSNPELSVALAELQETYPDHTLLPFIPIGENQTHASRMSLIVLPKKYTEGKQPNAVDITALFKRESDLRKHGAYSKMQQQLAELKESLDLPVVYLEDHFVNKITNELAQQGYSVSNYYSASYVIEDAKNISFQMKQTLMYKPVTDSFVNVREWDVTDERLHSLLANKKLALPKEFNRNFVENLEKEGKKILGAELLVIKGVKL